VKPKKALVITKRDGTLERFSVAKLRTCLARALREGGDEPQMAGPLAQAIAVHLCDQNDPEVSTSEYVYGCARAALTQTGLACSAEALAAHRRLREARRQRVRVYDPLQCGRTPVRWRKGAIVATLQNVYDLRQTVARFLGGLIEARIFDLGYRLLSKSFLAELVRNEVLAWGLLFERASAFDSQIGTPNPVAGSGPPKED
jgi:hypothetical protein